MKRLIVLFCSLLMLVTLSACSDTEINALTSTVYDGTSGFTSKESFSNLFDLDINTKWCVNPFEESYVIWETSEIIKPTGYIMVTANDNETYKGRNPASWTLYGSYDDAIPLRGSDTWEIIDRVEGSTALPDTNYTEHYFEIADSEAYDYYMLIIDEVQSGTVMQLSEFALLYKGGDYVFFNSATGSTLPHGDNEDYDEDYEGDTTEYYNDSTSTTSQPSTEPYEPTTYNTPETTTTTKKPVSNGESYLPNLSTSPRFYGYLSEDEKIIYDQMCAAIESFTTEITPEVTVTTDSLRLIHKYIQLDHPEYFWADRGLEWSYIESNNRVTSVRFKYQYPKNVVPTIQLQIDKAVAKICEGITSDFTEYDIALHVYEQLINTIDYDTVGLQIQESTEEGFKGADDLRSIYGAFIDKRCVCVGYAYATQYILQKYGIECSTISNNVHSWNLVKLEGNYYYIDTTWGDPSNTDPLKESSDEISYTYFCMTTETLNSLESHEIPSDIPVPECTATKCNYFIRNGLYFESLDTARLQSLFDKSFANGGEPIKLVCADASCYKELTDYLFEDGAVWDYVRSACSTNGCKEPAEVWHTTYDSSYAVKIYYKYF